MLLTITTTLFLTGIGNKFLTKKNETEAKVVEPTKLELIQAQEVVIDPPPTAVVAEVQDSPVISPTLVEPIQPVQTVQTPQPQPVQPVVTADVKPASKPTYYYRRRFFR